MITPPNPLGVRLFYRDLILEKARAERQRNTVADTLPEFKGSISLQLAIELIKIVGKHEGQINMLRTVNRNTPFTRSSKHRTNVEQMYSKYTC